MISIEEIETEVIRRNNLDLITYLQDIELLKREMICERCLVCIKLVSYKRNKDGYPWRCCQKGVKNT